MRGFYRVYKQIFILLFLSLLIGGCHYTSDPYYDRPIYITEIEVDYLEGNLSPNLEVEVHLYEAGTNALLACSGDRHGLSIVDTADVRYRVRAKFYSFLTRRTPLYLEDIDYMDIYIQVSEDDRDECPLDPFDPRHDDLIGQSAVFRASDLYRQRNFSFGDVTWLRLGAL